MITTRTPLRVSFLGGGTDYPEHFLKHGGQTLGAAMNKYTFITVKPLPELFDYTIRVSYSRIELTKDVEGVEHPSVRECLKFASIRGGIEIGTISDLPARTGVGSSSSFTVGLLHALHAYKGELVNRLQLAAEAVHVEQDMIREHVGVQDQYTCAHGGLVHIQCHTDGTIHVTLIPLRQDRREALEQRLLLYYTGIQRNAHEVLDEQIRNTVRGDISSDLGVLNDLVSQGVEMLCSEQPLAHFGEILHSGWLAKRRLSSRVTNTQIDQYYEAARRAGAIGGKLMGAGAGGFLLLFVEPDDQAAVHAALGGLHRARIAFDYTGSTIIFYDPDASEPHRARNSIGLASSEEG